MINIEFKNYGEAINFIKNEKDLLFIETFTEIKNSIKNNKDIAKVANLSINNFIMVINIDKVDWVKHLKMSIKYFERIEDYETCIEINNVIKNL